MRRFVVLALVALATAPAASAKGISAVEVCGAEGCVTSSFAEPLYEWPGGRPADLRFPPAEPFVEVRLTMDGSHWQTLWYVPRTRRLAMPYQGFIEWRPLAQQPIDRAIRAVAERIEPFPRPRIVAARIGGAPVERPAALDAVFAEVTDGKAAANDPRSVPVSVAWSAPNPWQDAEVRWIPETRLWQRGPNVYLVGGDLLRSEGRNLAPWAPAAVGLAALAGLALLLRRRRRLALALAGAALTLLLAAPALAKFPIALRLSDSTPRVGQQVRITVSIPQRYAKEATMRVVAVPPGMGMYDAIKAEERHGVELTRSGATWRGSVRFRRPGRWLLVVPNWGAPGYALPPPMVRPLRVARR